MLGTECRPGDRNRVAICKESALAPVLSLRLSLFEYVFCMVGFCLGFLLGLSFVLLFYFVVVLICFVFVGRNTQQCLRVSPNSALRDYTT